MEKTHLEIEKDTRRRLRVWKAKRDLTYDESINRLLDLYEAGDISYDEAQVNTKIDSEGKYE